VGECSISFEQVTQIRNRVQQEQNPQKRQKCSYRTDASVGQKNLDTEGMKADSSPIGHNIAQAKCFEQQIYTDNRIQEREEVRLLQKDTTPQGWTSTQNLNNFTLFHNNITLLFLFPLYSRACKLLPS
jgi:hypothetical protein